MLAVEGIGALILWGHWLLSGTVPAADAGFYGLFHEGVSAFSTTGPSLGVTGQPDIFGRLVVIALMFWGRLGAITIVLALLSRGGRESLLQYPEETVLVG
jgi:trk system potassium uptake protein